MYASIFVHVYVGEKDNLGYEIRHTCFCQTKTRNWNKPEILISYSSTGILNYVFILLSDKYDIKL